MLDPLADREQVERVIGSIEEITRDHFGGSDETELRPAYGFATSPALDLDAAASLRLRAAYETTMPELYFGSSPLPPRQPPAALTRHRGRFGGWGIACQRK